MVMANAVKTNTSQNLLVASSQPLPSPYSAFSSLLHGSEVVWKSNGVLLECPVPEFPASVGQKNVSPFLPLNRV